MNTRPSSIGVISKFPNSPEVTSEAGLPNNSNPDAPPLTRCHGWRTRGTVPFRQPALPGGTGQRRHDGGNRTRQSFSWPAPVPGRLGEDFFWRLNRDLHPDAVPQTNQYIPAGNLLVSAPLPEPSRPQRPDRKPQGFRAPDETLPAAAPRPETSGLQSPVGIPGDCRLP
jgi:hypothetical protein